MLAATGSCLAAFSLHSAASRTRSRTSSFGVSTAILSFGNIGDRSRITKATSASGSAAGASLAVAVRRRARIQRAGVADCRRDIGREIGDGERQIAGDAHEGTHADHFVVADPCHGGDADQLAGERRLFRGRQPVALARYAEPVGADTERAAQRDLDPFRQRSEIGLAVERCENGAAHQSSAAQRRQNCAGEPLHRNAAAIDKAAAAAIDRQRRFVAELDGLGSPRSICAARPCLVQARRPLRRRSKMACRNQIRPGHLGRPLNQGRHDAGWPMVRQ